MPCFLEIAKEDLQENRHRLYVSNIFYTGIWSKEALQENILHSEALPTVRHRCCNSRPKDTLSRLQCLH